jgi:hypothetical protein
MRPKTAALAACLWAGATGASAAPPPDLNEWTPDASVVARVDTQALTYELPKGFDRLDYYARYYWGTVHDGRRVIEGSLIYSLWVSDKSELGKIHIVPESDAKGIADGGCTEVNVEYDVELNKITHIACNYELPIPPPPPKQ